MGPELWDGGWEGEIRDAKVPQSMDGEEGRIH